ncbi:hypothetical protein TNCV_1525911 [Trichonephila clavipes]|nr:hypothetical protein TNCV_1525911 [Trichonephila clavipes]
MQYQTRVRNSTCSFCNLLTSVADYSSVYVSTKNVHGCADLCTGAPSCWYDMRDTSRKETPSSKKSANGLDKIYAYDSDFKDPSNYIGPIKKKDNNHGTQNTDTLGLTDFFVNNFPMSAVAVIAEWVGIGSWFALSRVRAQYH